MTRRILLWLAAGPIVGASLLTALYLVVEIAGGRPLTDRPLNLAEAVSDDDPPAVVRLLHAGADPLATYPIGTDIMVPRPAGALTPLETAALRDRSTIIELFVRRGIPLDDATRAHLLCVATRAHARDALAALQKPGVTPVCSPRAEAIVPVPAR